MDRQPYYPERASGDKMYYIIQQLVRKDNNSPDDYYEWAKKNSIVMICIRYSYLHGIARLHADRYSKVFKLY
jgi:hypothetical protein